MKSILLMTILAVTLGACANGNAVPYVAAGVVGAVIAAEVIDHHRYRHCHYSEALDRRVCHWS